ncbi:MAG: hypothetical protein KGL62_12360 [Bradyrhizobium sp.]|uniref:hypothetical protein n=1 Tax=Bradyrhizobium sp. TaxID=376 RepID=UPI002397402C|nr:hypothetical protein [Bradyrhizobium sp.]MDE2603144.1 hypothetical protein [Bradyrhizobium sp.]
MATPFCDHMHRRPSRKARAVLAHSPPITSAVLAGSKSLDEAYNEVLIATGKINNDTIRLRKLGAGQWRRLRGAAGAS